MFIDILKVFVL